MSHLKTILFLVLSLAAGIGIGQLYLYWKNHPGADFTHRGDPALITGIGDAPNWRGFVVADPTTLPAVLTAADAVFATTIGIEYSASLSPSTLATSAKTIHAHRMRVALLPPPIFHPENPYHAPLKQIAAEAQQANIDYLVVSWLNTPPTSDYWLDQYVSTRSAFKGKIIFAATPSILVGIDCWDAGDLLGAIGPVAIARRLPSSPDSFTPHDLRIAWESPLTGLEFLARAHGKKLALLNMNIPQSIAARLPPDAAAPAAPNPTLQEMLYEALLLETKGRAAHTEMILFNWGKPADLDAPNQVPNLLPIITEAWDPKKSKVNETSPGPTPDDQDTIPASPTTTTTSTGVIE